MLDTYRIHEAERAAAGLPPLPLDPDQVADVTEALAGSPVDSAAPLLELLVGRVAPGVGPAARVKAEFLAAVARGRRPCPALGRADAIALLGSMGGGYNVAHLVELLADDGLGRLAAAELARIVLVHDAFEEVAAAAASGNGNAVAVLRSWADEEWLRSRPSVPAEIHLTVFKVDGETNTDDMSPATDAWSRSDIPLHARSFLRNRFGDGKAPSDIAALASERRVAFVGDVVGTGSSRKSAVNSLLWHIGVDIPGVPNRRTGGVVIAGRIAPIFFDTLQDSGALGIECPEAVERLRTADHIVLRPADGVISLPGGDLAGRFELRAGVLDAVRAGGRITLTVGRRLSSRAREALGRRGTAGRGVPGSASGPYTLAQKIVGRACGEDGVTPGDYCEPVVSTVGSQDTTGPMNRTELEDLACVRFGADLVLQTFCHTAAYPKPADVRTQSSLPGFMGDRGAVVLRPGDGIIHSWLNRMLLPDQVGTGSDSHTRFPLGISFPAGSGLVALAATVGSMPLTMPESVLVRFTGLRQPGITVRDLVNAVPYAALGQGLLSLDPTGKRNVFSGRIIEFEGVEALSVEEAFELTDSTAERSAAACTIALSEQSVTAHLRASVETLRSLVGKGYRGAAALERRAEAMEGWLARPVLLRADPGARYAAVVEVDMSTVTEPLLACPNDPDDVRPLSAVAGEAVDEVFVGSCMTNLGHFRSAGRLLAGCDVPVPSLLWVAPPTAPVRDRLIDEGVYAVFGSAGARTEVPGCSLCMGNQARVRPGATVVSTSTRNFPDRMGRDARVYLASAEVATVAAITGRLPSVDEYRSHVAAAQRGAEGAGATYTAENGDFAGVS